MRIYCSGIGGIGLSAYAALRKAAGHDVSGSDKVETPLTEDLRSQGIDVFTNQDGSHVPEDADLFVYSEAIPGDAPERKRAGELGVEQQSYFRALGELSKDCTVIAVTGTHGKSSTTAMAARILIEAEKDPTIVVGTKIKELNGRNWRKGQSDLFLLEACEYRHSFYYLNPNIVVLTSVDGDHFDFYESVEAYRDAYVEFLKRLPEEGIVVTHGNDTACVAVVKRSNRQMVNVDALPLSTLSTPGRHMQENAQLALGLAIELGVDQDAARQALKDYSGCWRRMEVKGETSSGATVIDDYGHHPKEVRATLQALKEAYSNRRLVCVFQPHTHDRTLKLYDDFVQSFNDASVVVVTEVYEARKDIETEEVDLKKFVADIGSKSNVECIGGGDLDQVEAVLRGMLQQGDVVVCMGAGTITNLAGDLAQ